MCPVVAAAWRAASTRMSASSNWRNATIVSAAWSGVSIARSSKASSALSLAVTRSRALAAELRQVGMSSVRRKESGVVLDRKAWDREHRPVARRGGLGLDAVEVRESTRVEAVPVIADLVHERAYERFGVEPAHDVVPQPVPRRQVGPGVRVGGREVAGQLRLDQAEPFHQRFDISDFHGIPLVSGARGTSPARTRPGRAGQPCPRRGCSRRLSSSPSGDRCPGRSAATRPCG